jgi:hypothetical protein
VAAVLGRCPKDIRRPETVRGRTGMPSTARSESFEAVDVHGVAPAAIAKRASAASSAKASMAVGTLVLKKRLVLNAPCGCLLGTLLGEKSWDINEPLETF